MLPTVMNIFIIFSFCNVHDVSWGTRDAHHIEDDQAEIMRDKYKSFRSKLLLIWLTFNWVYAALILQVIIFIYISMVI